MKHKLLTISILATFILFCYVGKTNIAGAPPGNTGAPGEGNCTSCHSGQPVLNSNQIQVAFSLNGSPLTKIIPGQSYRVKVQILGLSSNYGFQFTAKNPTTGLPAGVYSTNSTTYPNGSYVQNSTLATTANIPNGIEWEFFWIAPSNYLGDSVTFYVAGMLGNQNGQVTGDQVLLKQYTFQFLQNSPSININPSTPNRSCIGTNPTLSFTSAGAYDSTNIFYLELSFNNAQFAAPIVLDSMKSGATTNGSLSINTALFSGGTHFLRVKDSQFGLFSNIKAFTLTTLDTPKLIYNIPFITGSNDSIGFIDIDGGGKPNYSYSWTWNGNPIPSANGLDYTEADSFGTYQVSAVHSLCPNQPIQSDPFEFYPYSSTFHLPTICLPFFTCYDLPVNRNRLYKRRTQFYIQLSDSSGNFTDSSKVVFTSSLRSAATGFFYWGFPTNLSPSSQYRIRVKTTNPNLYSPPYPYFTVLQSPDTPIVINNNGVLQITNHSGSMIRWIKKGTGVISMANGITFTPTSSGIYLAQFRDSVCNSEFSNEINYIMASNNELNNSIQVFPNPSNDAFTLELNESIQEKYIVMYDMNGKKINPSLARISTNSMKIFTNNLQEGLYMVSYMNYRKKIIVVH